ncbi:uncharacterized protein A4U43_C07F34780 [Asparagus officinalis]|uniref:Uncharacterized protein n=1 Tax=Asparagus officinalis TaxID=4686 RepID=A0A5P1EJ35_ASPOF|nr:uncharacterized protein A4U43_C07F34780 [Asparagus officinalis]
MNRNNEYATGMNNTSSSDEQHSPLNSMADNIADDSTAVLSDVDDEDASSVPVTIFSSSSDEQHFLIDDAHPVHIHWDLKNAKLSDDPEPLSDYYVALISNHQVVLLDGDQKLEAFRRTGSGTSMFDPVLVSEHVFAKKRFITRAKLDVRSNIIACVLIFSLCALFDTCLHLFTSVLL